MKRLAIVAGLAIVAVSLASCSVPGHAFPGGPSPWLPGGAPGSVYAQPDNTVSAPAASTRSSGSENQARNRSGAVPRFGARKSLPNRPSVTMRASAHPPVTRSQ